MEQHIRCTLEVVRMTVRAQPRRRTATKRRTAFEIPFHISRDEQIEPAITIVIEPTRTRGPSFRNIRKLTRDVAKRAVAVVTIEIVCFVAADEQIDVSIV